jgi:putative transposase
MRSKQQRKDYETKISMDGKGRAIDNIYIEQFCRSLKYGYAYLNSSNGGIDLLKRG